MYRIHMVEDEQAAADALRELLNRYAREHGLSFQVTHNTSALPLMTDQPAYDIVFMDIQLPGINGMEAAELLRTYDRSVPLIFVTDLAQYAVRGYEVDAMDFIVKPVNYGALTRCLDKALRSVGHNRAGTLVVPTRDGARVILLSELSSVQVRDHDLVYTQVGGREPLKVRGSLGAVERQLAELGAPFVRVSQSCLANMALIRRITRDALEMEGGETLWFSRGKRKAAMERITDYLGGGF